MFKILINFLIKEKLRQIEDRQFKEKFNNLFPNNIDRFEKDIKKKNNNGNKVQNGVT